MLFLLSGLIANAQIHNNSINAIKFTLWPITQGKTHGLKTRHFIVRVELICDKAARINCFLFLKWDVIICCFFFTQLFDSFVHKIYACVQENMCTHVHLIRLLLSPLRVRIYTWDATNQNSFKFFFPSCRFQRCYQSSADFCINLLLFYLRSIHFYRHSDPMTRFIFLVLLVKIHKLSTRCVYFRFLAHI